MAGIEIWKHWPGYADAVAKVKEQTLEQDLQTIDDLFGRDRLRYGDGPEHVKLEALRQVEIEWRSDRNYEAEVFVNMSKNR